MTLPKRLADLAFAALLSVFLAPLILIVALAILLIDGRPVLYLSERMKTPSRGFVMVKFRTMRADPSDGGATGAHKAGRITPLGAFLRRHRMDEMPQLWNILRGDMSFVGPRPPLRRYVEAFPEVYGPVLRSRPGLTGLATITYNRHEAHLLSNSRSAEETEAIYCRACVPRKARLDLIYQAHASLCLDGWIILRTVFRKKRP